MALIAGGHTFGKTHGAADGDAHVGPEPEGAALEGQGLGWTSTFGSGKAGDAITSGLEGIWTPTPVAWDNSFFEVLFGYEWELSQSPAGAHQWVPTDPAAAGTVPDAHDPSKRHAPVMLTTDLSLRMDPIYEPISRRFLENPDEFADAFARAWFKLTHRDMGPVSRYLGPEVPDEQLIWQDPVPAVDHELVDDADIAALKTAILESGLSVSELVKAAWASASTFRDSDLRGGANGARIRLAPQNGWEANDPAELAAVLTALEGVQAAFNSAPGRWQASVDGRPDRPRRVRRGGTGRPRRWPRCRGSVFAGAHRCHGGADRRPSRSPCWSPPLTGSATTGGPDDKRRPEVMLVDRSSLLSLTAPEMTVLVGGLRVLGANTGGSSLGVLTDRAGALTNDFFVNLLDMATEWQVSDTEHTYEGRDRASGDIKWTASAVDLVFGSNSQLRAIAESSTAATTPRPSSWPTSWPHGRRSWASTGSI